MTNEEIEQKIDLIQKSTRPTFKKFVRPHDLLRMRSKFYYNWHLNRYVSFYHWAIIAIWTMLVIYLTTVIVIKILQL